MQFTLLADDLFSKFGFSDGDLLADLDLGRDPRSRPPIDDIALGVASPLMSLNHCVLVRTVERYLLPALPCRLTLDPFFTIHNPARVSDYDYDHHREQVLGISVKVTAQQVRAIADELRLAWQAEGAAGVRP